MKKLIWLIAFFSVAVFASNTNQTTIAADSVRIKPHIIHIAQVSGNTVPVFLEAENFGSKNIKIVAAICPIARQTELRRTKKMIGDIMSSHPAKTIQLKAHKKQAKRVKDEFSIMLKGLKKEPNKLHSIPITLVFEDGSYLRVNARMTQRS